MSTKQKAPSSGKSKKSINPQIYLAIALIVMGILLIVGGIGMVQYIIQIAITVIGVIFIVLGIIDLVKGNYPVGIFRLVLGIIVILLGWLVYWVAFIVYAAITLIAAIAGLFNKDSDKISLIIQIVVSVIMLLFAFGSKYAWNFMNILTIITGVFMIIDGAYSLYQLTIGSRIRESK